MTKDGGQDRDVIDNSAMQCLHKQELRMQRNISGKSSTNLLRLCHSRKTEGCQPNHSPLLYRGRTDASWDARMGVMRKVMPKGCKAHEPHSEFKTPGANTKHCSLQVFPLVHARATSCLTTKDVRRKFWTIPPESVWAIGVFFFFQTILTETIPVCTHQQRPKHKLCKTKRFGF